MFNKQKCKYPLLMCLLFQKSLNFQKKYTHRILKIFKTFKNPCQQISYDGASIFPK
eukprot:TRINITY_DN466_c0_g1_i2.p2 TRINITY_DN466_c0_g1~~TRINITY_DN466_c0_g1_i2.p2  ORF type:complete len:56 (-),score=1.85 TRINITY_DN466_c0_g1_i2:294-461(-)